MKNGNYKLVVLMETHMRSEMADDMVVFFKIAEEEILILRLMLRFLMIKGELKMKNK